jgi:imidazolonepropionase-like amidohydrolase
VIRAALAAALVAALGCAPAAHAQQRGDILITATRLFDGTRMRAPGAVLIRGNRIVAVAGRLSAKATHVYRYGNATILPGFVDLHVHRETHATLARGVTTVRNLGAPIDDVHPVQLDAGLRVLWAGPLITVPGGYPTPYWGPSIALNVTTPDEGRQAVDDLAARGAAVIKIALEPGRGWPMLSVDEVRAIVSEAHVHQLIVTAHAIRAGIAIALAGGVDELAHSPAATAAQLEEIVARHIPVVATLQVTGCTAEAKRIVKLGGTLLYGTDDGNPGIPDGIDVDELDLMVVAGLTPTQALAAATSKAAAEAGLAPLGRLVSGAVADVVVVHGDARKLGNLRDRPRLVVSSGVIRSS